MTDKTAIVNLALQSFGSRTTVTAAELAANSTNEAIQANLTYDNTRDSLLRLAPWDCGMRIANLTYITSMPGTPENSSPTTQLWQPGQPAPGWLYEYQYPADCLRACWLNPVNPTGISDGVPIYPVATGVSPVFNSGPPVRFKVQTDKFYACTAAALVAAGTGYAIGDEITLEGPVAGDVPFGAPAQIRVLTASGPGAILIDAASFLVSAVLLRSVPVNETTADANARAPIRQEILAGLGYIWRQPLLRATAVASTAGWFGFSIFGALISLFALKELGFEAGPLAMIYAVGGFSSLAGSVLARRVTRALGVGPAMIAGLLVAGLLLMPLAAARGHGALAAVCLVVQQLGDGAALVFMINEVSLRQTLVSPDLMGRVNASAGFLRSMARLSGVLVAGLAGETIGLRSTLGLSGAVVTVGAIFLALSSLRSLKTMPTARAHDGTLPQCSPIA